MRTPLSSTGFVTGRDNTGTWRFLGTCFAYQTHRHLVTAAHVVKGWVRDRLSVTIWPHIEEGITVEAVDLHTSADLAVLRVEDWHALSPFEPFTGIDSNLVFGAQVSAFGYPTQSTETGDAPVPRYLRGNIQRIFNYSSILGYEYVGLELSFGAPAGISGGPVALDSNPSHVVGMIAENFHASTYVHSIEEVSAGSVTRLETQRDFVNYGIAVCLSDHAAWIDRCVTVGPAGA